MNKQIALVSIQAMQGMSQEAILKLLPSETLAEIKAKDEHPFFQVYSVAHEGISKPLVLGEGYQEISWPRKAVQSIKNVIKKGLQFFLGHNDDNSTTNRKPLGEVVHTFEQELNGKLHQMVISYHPPEVREQVKDLDVCSMEAYWKIIEYAGNYISDGIREITGIALGKSLEDTPAFSGAKRLGMVQAFSDTVTIEKPKETKKMEITFNDVENFVKNNNVWPSQLFDLEKVKQDNKFNTYFTESEKKVADLEKENKDFTTQLEDYKTKYETANKSVLKFDAKNRLENILKQNKELNEAEKNFIIKRFDADNTDDLTDEGLSKVIESQRSIFKDAASLLTSKEAENNEFVFKSGDQENIDDDLVPEGMTKEEFANM